MSQEAIRDQILTILNDVTNIGQVHDYERHNSDWSAFLAHFRNEIDGISQIRGAMITYRGFAQELTDTDDMLRGHNFLIIFILGIDDSAATEKTAAEIVEDIVDDLDKDSTLNGASYVGVQPAQVGTFEPRLFGDVLCHYAEISKTVIEEFAWSS